MADKDHKPIDFITEPKGWIEAFTGLVVAVSAFIALFENYRYSLVFVTLGILIWVSIHLAFSTTMSPIQEGRKIPRYPKWRVPAFAGVVIFPVLLLSSMSYALYEYINTPAISSSTTTPSSSPSVLLMDSNEPQMIFNPVGGGTNTQDIRVILRNFPITQITEEIIYPGWDDSEIIFQMEPALIIIHNSAFYSSTTTEDPQKRLSSFLLSMENTKTKFLIYSRADAFEDEEAIKQYFENTFPFLVDRVDVLWVPSGETQNCSYWDCAETRERLRRKVKLLLGLP